MRKGSSIHTYTKTEFWPLDPKVEEVKLLDIAHALSLTCRANGHANHFFSVAQHSINCAKEAKHRGYSQRVQLACLLHDGSEAYISDMIRPVKRYIDSYLEVETTLQDTIYEKFGLGDLTEEEFNQVFRIDDAMLRYEMTVLMNNDEFKGEEVSEQYDLSFKVMEEVEKEFIQLIEQLQADLVETVTN